MKVTVETIGQRIKEFREYHKPPMTQKELAEKSGVGLSTIKNAETPNGNRTLSKIDDLLRISEALEVSPYELLTGNDEQNFAVCEDLGLSSQTVDKLINFNFDKRMCQKWPISRKNTSDKVIPLSELILTTIDILVRNHDLLFLIGQYLHDDFSDVPIDDADGGIHYVRLPDNGFLKKSDYEKLSRMKIMELLKDVREYEGWYKK